MTKLKLWQEDWEEADRKWEQLNSEAAKSYPLKQLSSLPNMVGITPDTAFRLKWKSLKWMVREDRNRKILSGFMTKPLKHIFRLLKSWTQKQSFHREGDFFFYGVDHLDGFKQLLLDKNHLFVLGFSYCHKPFECPSGRFSTDCIRDPSHPVCQQCFIGKCANAVTEKHTILLFITTIHYIGEKIFEIMANHPDQKIIFLITACELTLNMFGDWGNMAGIEGVGVRLDGRICNTMEAFQLSEKGIKPGLTVVLEPTKKMMLDLIRLRNHAFL